MRNIHVLPTEKPSRLIKSKINDTIVLEPINVTNNTRYWEYLNIYITSDEKIKEGDWITDCEFDIMKLVFEEEGDLTNWKKIILTTDPKLIADGVQSIDDEFLEWFVKNPSCEKVEVDDITNKWHKEDGSIVSVSVYKITIPKEEPKKHIVVLAGKDAVKEGFKQETLKEVTKRLSNTTDEFNQFVAGAKWQQEQDKTKYSEEEVYGMLEKLRLEFKVGVQKWQEDFEFDLDKFFEQFKKKS
jgi:hypothetical protein